MTGSPRRLVQAVVTGTLGLAALAAPLSVVCAAML